MAFLDESVVEKAGYRFVIAPEQVSVFKGGSRIGELCINRNGNNRARFDFYKIDGTKSYKDFASPVEAARSLEEEVTNG